MSIVSQKVDARNEIGWTGFVRAANKGIVRDSTGWVLCPVGWIPEAFTTDVNDVQGQFPVVFNTDRMPFAATHNLQYYYDNASAGGTIVSTPTAISLGKGVVSEEGGYILLDLQARESLIFSWVVNTWSVTNAMTTFSVDWYDVFAIHNNNVFWTITTPYNAPIWKKWILDFRTFSWYSSFIWQHNLSQNITWIWSVNNSFINVAGSMMQDRTWPIDNNNVVLYHYPNTQDIFNVPNWTFNVWFYAEYCFQSGTTWTMSISISPSYIAELKLVNI